MPKRCPICKSLSPIKALRCQECGHQFPPPPVESQPAAAGATDAAPVVMPAAAPAAAPAATPVATPAAASVPAPAVAVPAAAENDVAALAHARAQVATLQKDAVDRQAHVATLEAQVERQQNDQRAGQRVAPAVPVSQPLISRMLVTLSRWPRATMLALGVIGLGGTGLGGWALARSDVAPNPSLVAPIAPPDGPAPRPGPGAVVSDADLREQRQRFEDDKIALEKKEALVTKNDAAVKALEASVKRDQVDLATRQVALTAQEAAFKATVAAQARLPPRVEPARMGFFDFPLREVKNVPYFTATEDMMQGAGSSWPKKDCTVVSISPLDGDDRPTVIAATCTPAGIVINKLKGLKNGHTVRLVWQLKQP